MNAWNENVRKQRRWTAAGLVASGLILCFAFSASAQDGGWKTTGWIGYEGQGETDLDRVGDFDFWNIGMGMESSTMLGDSVAMSIGGDYRAVGYNFGGGFSEDPWGTVHVLRFNPLFTYIMNEKWSLLGGPSFEISAEAGADVGDSLTGGGVAGVGYKWSDTLSIVLGVVVSSQIEDDAWIQPFALINWGITDNLSFGVEARNSRGGEFRFTYALGDNWEFGIGAGLRRERFRLDDDGFASTKDGVGEEEAKVVNLRVAYKFSETLTIEGYGGTTIDGSFRLEDEDGDLIEIGGEKSKSDYDDGGYGGLRIKFGF